MKDLESELLAMYRSRGGAGSQEDSRYCVKLFLDGLGEFFTEKGLRAIKMDTLHTLLVTWLLGLSSGMMKVTTEEQHWVHFFLLVQPHADESKKPGDSSKVDMSNVVQLFQPRP